MSSKRISDEMLRFIHSDAHTKTVHLKPLRSTLREYKKYINAPTPQSEEKSILCTKMTSTAEARAYLHKWPYFHRSKPMESTGKVEHLSVFSIEIIEK